jgi:hypothetical protein
MSTLPVFQLNQESSASMVKQALSSIQGQGTAILSTLSQIELSTLVDYDRALTALNGRQQQAARVYPPKTVALFVVSDFNDIDQGNTTATIRADTASATLRERNYPTEAVVSSTSFSSSVGTVQQLDSQGLLFSVTAESAPTGTFTITLAQAVNLSLLTIDIAAMASNPGISVQVSDSGLTYTPATKVGLNGYRLNAWLPNTPTKYVQLTLTPSHPDNLTGNVYTFGVTDFAAATVSYNLASDIVFKPIFYQSESATMQLVADTDPNLSYYLMLDDGTDIPSFVSVIPNTPIQIPGIVSYKRVSTAINSSGVLALTLPAGTYPASVVVTNQTTGKNLPVVVGLSPADASISLVDTSHISLINGVLTVLPVPSQTTDLFTVTYLTGPISMTATLKVHLSTSDSTTTPIFTGASLEEI